VKRWLPITLLLLVSCTNETALELEITASEAVPAEVASWELRLYQLAEAEVCPSAEQAASAARVGRLWQRICRNCGKIGRSISWSSTARMRPLVRAVGCPCCRSVQSGGRCGHPWRSCV